MIKNAKAKGSRNERRTRDYLNNLGWECIKAGGSFGVFDLVAIGEREVLGVQVKSGKLPSPEERANMVITCARSEIVRRLIFVWYDYVRNPRIIEVKKILGKVEMKEVEL